MTPRRRDPESVRPRRHPHQDPTMPPMNKVVIFVSARRWFDRTHGNTYHSVRIRMVGQDSITVPLEYGYSEAYLDTAQRALVDAGILPEPERHNSGSRQRLETQLDTLGYSLTHEVAEVSYKRHLHDGGQAL